MEAEWTTVDLGLCSVNDDVREMIWVPGPQPLDFGRAEQRMREDLK